MKPHVVVLGLGTAGAAVAALCARRGLQVTGVDRQPLDATGARWVNGVPAWVFDAVRLDPPRPPEHLGGQEPFHLIAGWDGPRMTLKGVQDVDMRALTTRLLAQPPVAALLSRAALRLDPVLLQRPGVAVPQVQRAPCTM